MKNLHRPFTLLIGGIALIVGSCTVPETNNPSIVAQPTTSAISTNKELTPNSFKQVTVAKDIERPWGMAWLPDGTILITERVGRVKILRNGSLEQIAIAEIPNLFVSGQAGLMDISLHPRFARGSLWWYQIHRCHRETLVA